MNLIILIVMAVLLSGITYVSKIGIIKPSNKNHRDGRWIGWHYAHCMDYCYSLYDFGLLKNNKKKWTTKEIFEEVKDVIEQLIKKERNAR